MKYALISMTSKISTLTTFAIVKLQRLMFEPFQHPGVVFTVLSI